jgi:anti-sigma factor RsiW
VSALHCEDVREDLVAYLDGELSDGARARVQEHVATCLACRREIERLTRLAAWVGALPRVEPAADFDERMWQRLETDGAAMAHRRAWRPARWSLPALAAAAAVALALYSSLERPGTHAVTPGGGERVAAKAVTGDEAPARVADGAGGRDHESELAAATEPSLENVPPELVEHPELFLRYPVVRRMNKLEHFEEVVQERGGEPLGRLATPQRSLG